MLEELEERVHEAREDVVDLRKEGVRVDMGAPGGKYGVRGFEDKGVCCGVGG